MAMAATASVLAVSVYPDDASTLEQAAIQATFVVAGFVLVGVGLLLGNLVAFATYHQRDDARLAWAHERDELARIAKKSTKRADLLREREKLGEIMAEAGDLIAGVVGPDSEDDTMKIFSDALDLFRSGGPFFDESHTGRFYAVITPAREAALSELGLEREREAERRVVLAEMEFLERLMGEINAELLTLPR